LFLKLRNGCWILSNVLSEFIAMITWVFCFDLLIWWIILIHFLFLRPLLSCFYYNMFL
jgi:hypothetical protein